jgi:uncharacterized protein YecE (DUF72 family)
MTGRIFVGTSGWNYRHWSANVLYPSDLSQKDWLAFYVHRFSTVEINNTFYRLPEPRTFAIWAEKNAQTLVRMIPSKYLAPTSQGR